MAQPSPVTQGTGRWDTIRRAIGLLTPAQRREGAIVLGISILSAALSAMMVWSILPFLTLLSDPGRLKTDTALIRLHQIFGSPPEASFLTFLGIMTITAVVVSSALQILRTYLISRMTTGLAHSFGLRLLGRYLGQPWEYFLRRNTADLSAKLLTEAQEAVDQYYTPSLDLVAALATTTLVFLVLTAVNMQVAVLSVLIIGSSYGAIYTLIRRRIRRAGNQRVRDNSGLYRTVAESLKGLKDIRILGREQAYLDRFETHSGRVRDANVAVRVLAETPRHVIYGLIIISVVGLSLFIVGRGADGAGAIGEIVPLIGVFGFAGMRLVPELNRLYRSISTLQFGGPALDAIHTELAGAPHAAFSSSDDGPEFTREVRLEGVSYTYPDASTRGLDGIDLTIPAGQRLGIAGPSGAGKSTLGDIILGLISPTAGQILIDGVPLGPGDIRGWQARVGFVPQDIFLADATAAENIALGLTSEEIDRRRVEEAARAARIHEFLSGLPEGYETPVGEMGVRLSGGQRQRIAIARALYKGADLIVFDEATSALDSETEAGVMEAIANLPHGKTLVVIAHRLTTLDVCDKIAVIDQGRLAGLGDRATLSETCPAFRALARTEPEAST
ncbi:ABC transporter ATP-binding protein [Ovoidimarina sediminis]|uniref:ABC transporter ATP-binding protein n=1 Tax=Ovoidimarina sediminis TaxID=3079856 RepID=UPI0029310FEE|nr:ABC transporter ATP-binding protein [Rhodophyticola sp. MJ-SS7]